MDMKDYKLLMDDRPEKASAEEVNYRDDEGKERCGKCIHFFERRIDKFGVCEIFRPEDDDSVEEDYVCDFFSKNGDDFPMLPKKAR